MNSQHWQQKGCILFSKSFDLVYVCVCHGDKVTKALHKVAIRVPIHFNLLYVWFKCYIIIFSPVSIGCCSTIISAIVCALFYLPESLLQMIDSMMVFIPLLFLFFYSFFFSTIICIHETNRIKTRLYARYLGMENCFRTHNNIVSIP